MFVYLQVRCLMFLFDFIRDCDILLTVRLSTILVIDQLNAQIDQLNAQILVLE